MAPRKSGILPCKACRYPTRTSRATLRDAPGTRKRFRGMCQPCAEKDRPRWQPPVKPPTVREKRAAAAREENPADPAILASLEAFLARRATRLRRLERMTR